MRIHYAPSEGMVISFDPDEQQSIVRAMEALIGAFEDDCDVSFLLRVLEVAKAELKHTLQ